MGKPEHIQDRCEEITAQMHNAENGNDILRLKERLANMKSGAAVIRVGANSEAELRERRDRYEDALNATRAAIAEGILPGGGISYIRASNILPNEPDHEKILYGNQMGQAIVKAALYHPLLNICLNAGVKTDPVLYEIKSNGHGDYGYNAKTGNFEHLLQTGVIDPLKVVRAALENAASVAGILLTTECVIYENPPK